MASLTTRDDVNTALRPRVCDRFRPRRVSLVPFITLSAITTLLTGGLACSESPDSVVVYCSVDEAFARTIFDEFERRTGLRVEHVIDSEAGKTTGLLARIQAEGDHPRADVLFSSEIFGTVGLAEQNLLAPYDSPAASDIPKRFRDPQNRWTAIGLRGRVVAFDPQHITKDELPDRWEELAEPEWASRLAVANPLFGTTRGHVAAMFSMWGRDRATAFLESLDNNESLIVDSNSAAVRAVINGRGDVCMTDTDDVRVARRDGASLDMKYLDMGDGGTLWIPSTVALIRGAPNQENGKRLIDFLVSPDVERMLAESESGNIPVRSALREKLELTLPPASTIDYSLVAARLDESGRAVRDILLK